MTTNVLRVAGQTLELRYGADLDSLGPALAARFVELGYDAAAQAFVEAATRAPAGPIRMRLFRALSKVATPFDVNAWLRMNALHLAGESTWRRLLGDGARGRVLDVGAGSGGVTATLAAFASELVATETSAPAIRRLRARGHRAHLLDLAEPGARSQIGAEPFDVVACLNVLDRAERPRALLDAAVRCVAPGGRLLVATPLPYEPVHFRGGGRAAPLERLPITGKTWEAAARATAERVLAPAGLDVLVLARAPYLSAGDAARPVHVLDDAIFVCALAR
jgi:SAM-dependent methyltransferase